MPDLQQNAEQVARAVAQKYFDDIATVAALEVVDALRAAGLLVQPGQVAISMLHGGELTTEYGREEKMCFFGGEPFTTKRPVESTDQATHMRLVFPWVPVSGDADV